MCRLLYLLDCRCACHPRPITQRCRCRVRGVLLDAPERYRRVARRRWQRRACQEASHRRKVRRFPCIWIGRLFEYLLVHAHECVRAHVCGCTCVRDAFRGNSGFDGRIFSQLLSPHTATCSHHVMQLLYVCLPSRTCANATAPHYLLSNANHVCHLALIHVPCGVPCYTRPWLSIYCVGPQRVADISAGRLPSRFSAKRWCKAHTR